MSIIYLNFEKRVELKFLNMKCYAEEEGFEPPDLLQSTVFKTAAFDRSAIPPSGRKDRQPQQFLQKTIKIIIIESI